MKEISMYVCEVCGTQYASRWDCETCESSHKIPKKIVGKRYVRKADNGSGYPVEISVEMSDGTIQTYKR